MSKVAGQPLEKGNMHSQRNDCVGRVWSASNPNTFDSPGFRASTAAQVTPVCRIRGELVVDTRGEQENGKNRLHHDGRRRKPPQLQQAF